MTPPPAASSTSRRPSAKERLKKLIEEYGSLALGTFVVLSVLVLGSFWAAVRFGWQPQFDAVQDVTFLGIEVGRTAPQFAAAYIAYRFTLPLRIAAAAFLTPVFARLLERLRLRQPS